MNKRKDNRGETVVELEDVQLSAVVLTAEQLIKCRPIFTYIPVHNTQNTVYRGRLLDVDIQDTTIEPEQSTFQDFGMNVNMELSENHFVFNWPYHIKLNHMTGALFTIIFTMFLWFIFGLSELISNHEVEFDSLFFIIKLYVAGTVVGKILSMVCDIPPSVGMVLVGIALSNSGQLKTKVQFVQYLWLYICELIETVILIICGLELNIWDLRWTGFTVLKLAILPQTAEAIAVILVAHYLAPEFVNSHFQKYMLLNSVGIHSVLFMSSSDKLKYIKYFDMKNIYTLLNAASIFIDMAAVIFNYFIMSSVHNSDFKLTGSILDVAKEVSIDIVFGILWGLLIVFVASLNLSKQYDIQSCRDNNNQELGRQITGLISIVNSVVLLFFGGILVVIIKIFINTPWSFALSSGISSLVAGTCWRWRIKNTYNSNVLTMTYNDGNEYENHHHAVLKVFECSWKYLQPLYFGLIGAGFQFEYFSFWMLLIVPLVLVFELTIRVLITTLSVWGSGFNRNELIFINIAWLPNSTLLAGVVPIYWSYYDTQPHLNLTLAGQVFNLTIVCYLITTILGSFSVLHYGQILLPTTINNK